MPPVSAQRWTVSSSGAHSTDQAGDVIGQRRTSPGRSFGNSAPDLGFVQEHGIGYMERVAANEIGWRVKLADRGKPWQRCHADPLRLARLRVGREPGRRIRTLEPGAFPILSSREHQ